MFCVGDDDGKYRRESGIRYHPVSCQSRVLRTASRLRPLTAISPDDKGDQAEISSRVQISATDNNKTS